LIELVHRPRFAKARCELVRRFGCRLRFRQEADKLAGAHGPIISAPCFVGDPERFFRST
jgi:hypothetical protein